MCESVAGAAAACDLCRRLIELPPAAGRAAERIGTMQYLLSRAMRDGAPGILVKRIDGEAACAASKRGPRETVIDADAAAGHGHRGRLAAAGVLAAPARTSRTGEARSWRWS